MKKRALNIDTLFTALQRELQAIERQVSRCRHIKHVGLHRLLTSLESKALIIARDLKKLSKKRGGGRVHI